MSSSESSSKFAVAHIAVAVPDLDQAKKKFEAILGCAASATELIATDSVRVCFFELENVRLELVAPVDSASSVARFIDKRGAGVHHLALRVPGTVASALETLAAKDVPLIDKKPRSGAGGTNVAFIHPRGGEGVLIELVGKSEHERGR